MKFIVLCEPHYDAKNKNNGSKLASKNSFVVTSTVDNAMSNDTTGSDVEIYSEIKVVGDVDIREKDDSKDVAQSELKNSENAEHVGATSVDDEEIEIICDTFDCIKGESKKTHSQTGVIDDKALVEAIFNRDSSSVVQGESANFQNDLESAISNLGDSSKPKENSSSLDVVQNIEDCEEVKNLNTENREVSDIKINNSFETGETDVKIDTSSCKILPPEAHSWTEIPSFSAQNHQPNKEKDICCNENTHNSENQNENQKDPNETFTEKEGNKNRKIEKENETFDGLLECDLKREDTFPRDDVSGCQKTIWETKESPKLVFKDDKFEFLELNDSNQDVSLVENCLNLGAAEFSEKEKVLDKEKFSETAKKEKIIEEKTIIRGDGENDDAYEIEVDEECHKSDVEMDEVASDGSGAPVEGVIRKRKRMLPPEEDVFLKKKRLENGEKGKDELQECSEKNGKDGEEPDSISTSSAERINSYEEFRLKEGESGKTSLEESIDRMASTQMPLPFLKSLRGTIKTLSRNDLEELIVQKLCEVITERSSTGELRRRAQALEQDQKRWKDKVQSLTKQLREMDMVMKKYMSEVQKQNKERSFQMIAPLRVTRSVGLQVSFSSSGAKSKSAPATNPPPDNALTNQDSGAKEILQRLVNISQNQTKKGVTALPSAQAKKVAVEPKKPQGINVTLQARLIPPQAVSTATLTTPASQVSATRPTLPVTDQSCSKIIDLTDDDDKQNSPSSLKPVVQPSVNIRAPGQIRVVNHIQPGQVNANNRVAYLVPATTTTASGSGGPTQSRQLLIATPTVQPTPRQILPSVPPLLYKGSTVLQPGAQHSQLVGQQGRLAITKLKHPAPLPLPPISHNQKPNLKLLPPRPALKISKVQTGIVLSWNMMLGPEYEPIASYQLYAYQENNNPPATSLWKKVGDVKALPLPMACTLTQFMSGHKYHFAVRAVDLHSRIGPFSLPGSIVLIK